MGQFLGYHAGKLGSNSSCHRSSKYLHYSSIKWVPFQSLWNYVGISSYKDPLLNWSDLGGIRVETFYQNFLCVFRGQTWYTCRPYLRYGCPDWMTDEIYDFGLWPNPWPSPWISRSIFQIVASQEWVVWLVWNKKKKKNIEWMLKPLYEPGLWPHP